MLQTSGIVMKALRGTKPITTLRGNHQRLRLLQLGKLRVDNVHHHFPTNLDSCFPNPMKSIVRQS